MSYVDCSVVYEVSFCVCNPLDYWQGGMESENVETQMFSIKDLNRLILESNGKYKHFW